MNSFRTLIPASNFPFKISQKSRILCLGSCFTENIGSFLTISKFNAFINPFGIIYNPFSICRVIDRIVENDNILSSELIHVNNRYYHWDFHGDYAHSSSEECIDLLNTQISKANKFIQGMDVIYITLGTANAFLHNDENRIVANCHKVDNSDFKRIELSITEITSQLKEALEKLRTVTPNVKVVFTVSPVRHVRDGMVENQLSKSKLIQSIHHLVESLEEVYYFPSYELVMDDLRDYRFYAEDMIHINQTGLDYIWEYFKQSFFDNDTVTLTNSISKINKDIAHKPFHPDSIEHQKFLNLLLKKIKTIKSEHPYLNFEKEEILITNQIST